MYPYSPMLLSLYERRTAVVRILLALTVTVAVTVAHGQNVTVTNVFDNHYSNFPAIQTACTANIPSGQYPTTYHLERGHYIHHYDPQNAANDYWVYWAHFDNSNYSTAEVAVFKSTTQCGPYMLQTNLYSGTTPSSGVTDPGATYNVDGNGYGFTPGGWQSRDENIFVDTATQTYNPDGSVAHYADGYLYTASNSLNTIPGNACSYANDSIAAFHMTPDYMHIDTTTSPGTNGANWIFPCAQREAPVLFRSGSYYFLIVSQAAGWYPSQGAYGSSSGPLTGFQATPLVLGNTSTFGGQTADGFVIAGTQANAYVLDFDHLGGSDTKNPAYSGSSTDTGFMYLPVALNGSTGVATLNWESSWSVNMTTGVVTLPSMPNLALTGTTTSTVTSAATSGVTTYVPGNATDGSYSTLWKDTLTGSSSFNAAAPTTSTICPVSGATLSTTCYPSLVVDLGSSQPVQEVDISTPLTHGSEAYFTYQLAYSTNKTQWTTLDYTAFAPQANATAADIAAIPFSNPVEYGFNALPVNFTARYVALLETSAVQQNSTTLTGLYGPSAYEFAVIKSTAPVSPLPVNVSVMPSGTDVSASSSFTVTATVTDPTMTSTPTGYVQLSNPNYISNTYGLVSGSVTFTVPAAALPGGNQTLTVSYRPDTTGVPIYGTATTTGSTQVMIDVPLPPTVTVTAVSPGALGVAWTTAKGATGYVIYRSTNNGASFSQLTTTTSATSYTDTPVTNGSTYCYEVAASNLAGTGSPSASVCAVASNNFPVTGLTVAASGPGALVAGFTAVANAANYTVKRSINGAAYTTLTSSLTTTSYTDTGLTPGGNVCYTVAANFATGSGADSAPVCATPTAATPPLNLVVTPWASGQLYLSWLVNGSASSYTINRSVNGGAYSPLVSSQSTLYYTDGATTALTNGSTYCYTVSETQAGVTSASSSAVCTQPVGTYVAVGDYGFEAPTVGLWSTTASFLNGSTNPAPTWTFVSSTASNTGNNSGVSALSGTFTNQNTPPIPLGNQVGLLEGTGSVSQTITGLTSGKTYYVIISASQRQISGSPYQVGGPEPFTVTVGGNLLATFTPPQPIPYYRDYVTTFTAAGPSASLVLTGTGLTTAAVLLDNVRIFQTAATAQAINFTQPPSPAIVSTSTSLSATGGASGNPVVFSIISGPATLSGTNNATITYTGAGTVVIAADQAGGSTYAAAPEVTRTVTVTDTTSTSVMVGNPSVTAYGSVNISVAVSDVTTPATTPTGTVTFTDTVNSVQTIIQAAVGLSAGGASISYTPTVTGAHTIGASYAPGGPTLAASSGSTPLSVTAQPLATLTVTGYPASAPSGVAQNVTVTAYDASNRVIAGFTGTVTLTSSDASAALPAAYLYTSADAGAHVFAVTLNTAGTQGITAFSGGITGSETSIVSTGYVVAVSQSNNTLSKFTENGVPYNSSGYTGGGGLVPVGAAADAAGNVFTLGTSNGALAKFDRSGVPQSGTGYVGGGISAPKALVVDGAGQVWVANGPGSLSVFTNSGVALSPGTTGYASGGYSGPSALAVDISGNVWVVNASNNTITEVLGAAAPVSPPSTALTNGTTGARP